jgi:hypothetical protein
MNTGRKIHFVVFTALLISACMLVPPGLSQSSRPPTETPLQATSIPRSPTAEVKPLVTPDTQNDSLNDLGPWLVMSTDKGLWAANPNGSGLKQLLDNNLPSTRLQDAVQPGGSLLAVITSDSGTYHHMQLKLLSLPDGNLTPISALTSDATEKAADGGPGDPGFESLRAISEQGSLAWSPDGQKLAFIGFMDGPSADLYLYERSSGKITRMDKEPSEDFAPSWAPDGRHILFLGAESFGTGAGVSMTGVWSAAVDGAQVTRLYQPKSSGETIHGWMDRNTAVISSWGMMCGSAQLRFYNIANEEKRIVQKDCFSDAVVSPQGSVLFGSSQGLFVYAKNAKKATQLDEGNVTQLFWDANSQLAVARFEDGRLLTVDGDGKNMQVSPVNSINDVGAYGSNWAWSSYSESLPGVWISREGQAAQQIFTQKASSPIWDPNNYLLFFSGRKIYRTHFPDYTDAVPVATLDASLQEIIWVGK